jgi:hypothetical protein
MITIYTTARPFRGHFGVIQRNAIQSWTLLDPRPNVLLIGDEEGYRDAARDLGITHLPQVELSEQGTPLLNSMVAMAEAYSGDDLFLLMAADTILFDDVMRAARIARDRFRRFCVVAGRNHARVESPIDFGDPRWRDHLRDSLIPTSKADLWAGDFFLYSRGLWEGMPSFAVGRTIADNWMFYHVVKSGAALIDATRSVVTLHQDHDYSHHPDGVDGVFGGDEARTNRALVSPDDLETMENANWILGPDGLRRPPPSQLPKRLARKSMRLGKRFVRRLLTR